MVIALDIGARLLDVCDRLRVAAFKARSGARRTFLIACRARANRAAVARRLFATSLLLGYSVASHAVEPALEGVRDLVGSAWTVELAKDPRVRRLGLEAVQGHSTDGILLRSRYGYPENKGAVITTEVRIESGMRRLVLTTQSGSTIDVREASPDLYVGSFRFEDGRERSVSLARIRGTDRERPTAAASPTATDPSPTAPSVSAPKHEVLFVYMGGNDCPPCRVWRAIDLPKLQASPEFKFIEFAFVIKSVGASVPPTTFLPESVRPYKLLLDTASSGGPGSPQSAIIVDGKVFDYFHGTRSASEIEAMLRAIRTDAPYPQQRCAKMSSIGRACEAFVPAGKS